jgi:hypothetical protein
VVDHICKRDKQKEADLNPLKNGKLDFSLLKKEVERNVAVEHTYMDF